MQAKHTELLVVGLVPGGMFQAHLQQLANIGAGLDPSATRAPRVAFQKTPRL